MSELLEQDNPILRQIAEPVSASEFGSNWIKKLTQTLLAIMASLGAVGVAAPQMGVSKRVIVFGTSYTKRRKPEQHIPDTILINPSLKIMDETQQLDDEGCLNCGTLRGTVPRAMTIEYSGFDLEGNNITKQASGLEARILQHEVDHLNGVLFFDRVMDKDSLINDSR